MAEIKIRKGHNLNIKGQPEKKIDNIHNFDNIAIYPSDFRYVKPRLLVKEGDQVKIGSAIFYDKLVPNVKWPSPACGKISEIQYGSRKIIEKISIEVNGNENEIVNPSLSAFSLKSLKKEKILNDLINSNFFPFIKSRPFNKVANPDENPRDIFISGINSGPLSCDLEFVLSESLPEFQAGLDILSNLTEGKVHLTLKEDSIFISSLENVELHSISGPHPCGNVGIQIHHISPLKPDEIIWTIDPQHVVILGKLFLTGKFDPSILVSIGGPIFSNPKYIRTKIGASIKSSVIGQELTNNYRLISGNILNGITSSINENLHFYDTCLSGIIQTEERKFLGMIYPGNSDTHYSLTNTFINFDKKPFNFSTLTNGSERPIYPLGYWEDVLPMDILPNELYRSIISEDIELMESLGILECDEEDFSLCTFSCASKIDVGLEIRKGLDMIWKEKNQT